ncbi:hypothetical protein [Beijerinckia sp. L45]|uniref:hypothetical protein n=1 Tax=Beijerinckia sp. L45 TaxID=1641855 RepID=UPI00131C745E|nr:hypothetical protein [Beijerinckia sp. L45]
MDQRGGYGYRLSPEISEQNVRPYMNPVAVFFAFFDALPMQIRQRFITQLCAYFCHVLVSPASALMAGAPVIQPFQQPSTPLIPTYNEERLNLENAICKSARIEEFREFIKLVGVMDYLFDKSRAVGPYQLALLAQETGNTAFSDLTAKLPLVDAMDDKARGQWIALRATTLSFGELEVYEATLP